MAQIKYRYAPQRFPVKFGKLKEYQYFLNIAKQFDSSFMRSILPYSCEIVTTKNLELQKFVYVLISKPSNFILEGKIGYPVLNTQFSQTKTQYELENQETFIRISIQVHIILDKLLNLDMSIFNLPNASYNDKFWFFSQGELKIFNFNDIAYKVDQNQEQMGIYIFLEGQFKCINGSGKNFKNIGEGFCISTDNRLFRINGKKFACQNINSENKIKQIIANSNLAKVLFLSKKIVKKYFPDCVLQQELTKKNLNFGFLLQKQNIKPFQLNKHKRFKTQIKQLDIKQLKKQKTRGSVGNNQETIKPKFKLVSNRDYNQRTKTIQQITSHQIVKEYIKDHFTYKNLPQIKKHISQKDNFFSISNNSKGRKSTENSNNYFSKFKKQKLVQKNVNELNQFSEALKTLKQLQSPVKKSSLIDQKLEEKRKTLQKSQLKALKLLKRNIMNKIYHQSHHS